MRARARARVRVRVTGPTPTENVLVRRLEFVERDSKLKLVLRVSRHLQRFLLQPLRSAKC